MGASPTQGCFATIPAISALIAGILLVAGPVFAGPVGNEFTVSVEIVSSGRIVVPLPGAHSDYCLSTDPADMSASSTIIVCATGTTIGIIASESWLAGTPIHGGAPLYGVVYQSGTLSIEDMLPGLGSVLTWRRIILNDQDYLELHVSW